MSNSVDSGVARGVLRCVQVVGFLLLVAGGFRAVPVVRYVWDFVRMRQWSEVPATVLEADYRKQEEDDIRPRVIAEYRYSYNGVEHHGNRVDIAESSEFLGDFQKQMADELKQHLKVRTQTTAYVNPSLPEESVLYPRFIYTAFGVRLFIFFLLAFFGWLLFWLMTHALHRQKQQVIEERAHPNEPWLWRRDWANKLVRTSSYKYAWFVVFIAAMYLLVFLPLSLLTLREWGREILSIPGVILILVGWAFFNAARLQLKNAKTFKGAELRMSSVPGLIGGSLAGVVVLPRNVPDDTRFRVVLECAEYQHSRKPRKGAVLVVRVGSDKIDTSEHVEWRDAVTVEKTLPVPGIDGTAIPVYFAIPYDCKPSGLTEITGYRWRLKTGIEESNFHRYASFDVPVFKTAESSPTFVPDPTVMQPFETVVDAQQALKRLCRTEPLAGGGERIRFSYFDPVVLVAALVLVALCGGGITAIFYFEAHPAWAIFPGMLGVAFFVGMTLMLLWGASLEIRRDTVAVISGYAGFRKRHDVPLTDVVDVEFEKEHSLSEQDHYCVLLKFRLPIPEDEIEDLSDLPPEEQKEELEFLRNVKYVESLTLIKRLERRQQAEAVCDLASGKARFIRCNVEPLRGSPTR